LAPHFWGCQLPDAIGHGSGVTGLVEGLHSIPVYGSNELLSKAIQLASVDGYTTTATSDQNEDEENEDEDDW
jgi:hypothetical protein